MLPGKIFFENLELEKELPFSSSNLKLNLILNNLLYDELRLYHIKYLCVTPADALNIQIVEQDTQSIIAAATINEVYQLIADNKTVDLRAIIKQSTTAIKIKLAFQTLGYLNKKKNAQYTLTNVINQSLNHATEEFRQSFRERILIAPQPKRLTEAEAPQESFEMTQPIIEEQNESEEGDKLQMLAQQRQKILGELFGKFKRDR